MAELSEIRVFTDAAELLRAAADEIASCARRIADENDRFTWCLSGGSTPRGLYRLLAGDPYRECLPWHAMHFFWGDERHVPPDHPESNFRMAREAMLDAVPVPPENIHRIAAEEADAERAALLYQAELRSFFALAPGEWPRFDLVLLGLGKDAHTASLFPGSAALRERRRLVVAPWVEEQRAFRITLTPPALNHARRTLFLVSGAEKAAALRTVIEGEREPDRYPAQAVEGNRLWLVDGAAARLLSTAR
ncbi:MAG TPA: 6-phosphogluconolactonase [Thermoanaerobaculia bacterium]|nr:6-phosphogluconolactonase [Thermoanaerobaculia bacterium]